MSATITSPDLSSVLRLGEGVILTEDETTEALDYATALLAGADPSAVDLRVHDPATHRTPVELARPLIVITEVSVERVPSPVRTIIVRATAWRYLRTGSETPANHPDAEALRDKPLRRGMHWLNSPAHMGTLNVEVIGGGHHGSQGAIDLPGVRADQINAQFRATARQVFVTEQLSANDKAQVATGLRGYYPGREWWDDAAMISSVKAGTITTEGDQCSQVLTVGLHWRGNVTRRDPERFTGEFVTDAGLATISAKNDGTLTVELRWTQV